jgi:hypothetical protein
LRCKGVGELPSRSRRIHLPETLLPEGSADGSDEARLVVENGEAKFISG